MTQTLSFNYWPQLSVIFLHLQMPKFIDEEFRKCQNKSHIVKVKKPCGEVLWSKIVIYVYMLFMLSCCLRQAVHFAPAIKFRDKLTSPNLLP